MDTSEGECAKDDNQLNRNRSFKSKQLVRSQAIRESTSPPRTVSPSVRNGSPYQASITDTNDDNPSPTLYQDTTNGGSPGQECDVRKTVEIQITSGGTATGYSNTESWSGGGGGGGGAGGTASDGRLLSQAPRTACVCGDCTVPPNCRGKRRKHTCPTKQDSGIVCSDDCPDCSDTEHNGTNDETRKPTENEDQTHCRFPERKDRPKTSSLTRTDSDEKQEPTGPELVNFLKETLNKNGRDRVTLLRLEKELHSFVNDNGRCIVKFPVLSSYGRMLVHRVAALFQLTHHVDHYNKHVVVVSKTGTSGGCIPCTSFKTWCVSNFPPSPRHIPDNTLTRSILKRDTHSLDEPSSGSLAMNRSKSLEQREKEYERVRRRIFSTDNCSQDESQWPWLNSGPIKLLTPDSSRNKLLKVQSLEGQPGQSPGSWRGKSAAVSKSHSFGGYVEHHRTLSRQGDLASSSWRLSPGSSGYKTLSVRSTESATPSPPPAPGARAEGPVVWCVTDMAAVPPGALLIHPQTGRPLTNPDGSIYHYDPSNPPTIYDPNEGYDDEDKIDPNNEKRRGRLEKQHSFNDNDSECHQTDECRSKCCDCRRPESQAKSQDKPQEPQKPSTPIKNQHQKPPQNTTPETTNHKPPETATPNQIQPQLDHQPITERDSSLANQRPFENQMRSFEANQREGFKFTNQETVFYHQPYNHGYNEEVNSPSQLHQYMPTDMSNMNMMPQAKITPMPVQDSNIRPVSLTNMMYQPTVQPTYYIPNQCRMEQLQQPMYQPMLQQQIEEQKQLNVTQQDTPFRIDPSYPYAPLEYGQCPCEPAQPQRSYSVYSQPEAAGVAMAPPNPYPMHNVLLPHPAVAQYPVQYPEPVQWVAAPKLVDMCPVVYPPQYAHYNLIYPQMVPQPYPVIQPVYPLVDKHERQFPRKKTSLPNSTRATPLTTPDKVPYEEPKQDNAKSEIEAKINQIKEQMAQMNTRPQPRGTQDVRREDWRRNNGNGILGNYPHNAGGGRNHGISQEDNTQLSSAARAIVNSIRNMQAKNTYQEKRYDNNSIYSRDYNTSIGQGGGPRPPAGPHKHEPRPPRPHQSGSYRGHPPFVHRQMTPSAWCRRSPAPVHPVLNSQRRPHPDTRNIRR